MLLGKPHISSANIKVPTGNKSKIWTKLCKFVDKIDRKYLECTIKEMMQITRLTAYMYLGFDSPPQPNIRIFRSSNEKKTNERKNEMGKIENG